MHIDTQASTPLYLQIHDTILRQIETGAYADGARLPSERELAELFGVSRMTARQAMRLLMQDGRINTRVGKGTFVQNPRLTQELRELTSFTDDIRRAGARPTSLVLNAEITAADVEVAAHLEVEIGTSVVHLHRVRIADGEFIALEKAYLVHTRCAGILDEHDFARESLYSVLKEVYGVRLVWASEAISARMPEPGEREALKMQRGVPVLSMKRITYDERDEPVEYVKSCYHSERYQLRTILRDNTRSTNQ